MNRRDFLGFLGLTGVTLAVAPELLTAPSPAVEVFTEYPALHFTGFKSAWAEKHLAGQFLWTVDWIDEAGEAGKTFWYCTLAMDDADIDGGPEAVRARIQNSLLSTMRLMDGIVEKAHAGLVDTGQYEAIPNPDFDPSKPATTGWDDDDQENNPRTISGPPITKKVRSVKLSSFKEKGGLDGWDSEKMMRNLIAFARLTPKGTWIDFLKANGGVQP